MKLTIELSETQAHILRDALDAYSRLLTGQVGIAVMDTAQWLLLHQRSLDPKPEDPDQPSKFDQLRLQLSAMQSLLTGLANGCSYGIYAKEVPDRARQAYDLLQVIRHGVAWHLKPQPTGLWTVDFDTLNRTSEKEELPRCTVEK